MADKKIERLLLIGDSMIEYFDWQARFSDYAVENRGLSGESVAELLRRSRQIIPNLMAPDLVLIMIGTNNVAMEDFNFTQIYGDIIREYQEAFPAALVVVNSLLPMNLSYLSCDTVPRLNAQLRELADRSGVIYLDAYAKLADATGNPLADVLEDEVHLSAMGYRRWADCLTQLLNNLTGS